MNENLLKFHAGDIVVIAAILILAFAMLAVFSTGKAGLTVAVTFGGATEYYDLDKDRVITLDGLNVVISDGYVWVDNSDCPDKICVTTGKISKAGQFIACVPNETLVKITAESSETYADFISG